MKAQAAAAAALVAIAAETPSLEQTLRRAAAYVIAYERAFSAVVAEEEYVQLLMRSVGRMEPRASRSLRSDIILVHVPGELHWVGFRDVFEVDGQPVRDRQARLEKLFVDTPEDAVWHAQEILQESARYNIGSTVRNFNVPTIPLAFLHPLNQPRFAFEAGGAKKLEGRVCRVVKFEERTRPTLIRELPDRTDLLTHGRFHIAEEDGAVLRSELSFDSVLQPARVKIVVSYRWIEELAMWLPAEMSEIYERAPGGMVYDARADAAGRMDRRTPGEHIRCTARYKNFRRFKVQTGEVYHLPQ